MASENTENAYDPANDPHAVPRNESTVQHILNTVENESAQLDAVCEARGWQRIDVEQRDILDAYLAGTISLEDTAERLAAPIDESYTSADAGYQYWDMEMTARACRPQCTPDEVTKYWGEPVAMCEPDPALQHAVSTEGGLWGLWFGLMHAARKLPWEGEESGQLVKLVRLVQTLKARPNPPLPEGSPPALLNNWVWGSGALWSDLTLLGPAARESWNDAPGGTMGFTAVEVKAWERQNAYVAHLTAIGTADFLLYGIWAMRDALEGGIARMREMRRTPEMKAMQLEVTLGIIVVWLSISGEEMYRRSFETVEAVENVDSGVLDAWRAWGEISNVRWSYWKKRLGKFARDEKVSALARSHAARASEEMQQLEDAYEEMR